MDISTVVWLIILFGLGGIMLAAYNYLILYLIRVLGLVEIINNKIAIVILLIFSILIFFIHTNNVASSIGALLSTSSIAYFFTFAMFRGREAYRNYSRKIKLFAAIYSGLSLIVLNLLVYGKNIIY
tara:strand:+ start:374 stop:751 length:378 start_codon:yes stop_codon:yes gene_type:complete